MRDRREGDPGFFRADDPAGIAGGDEQENQPRRIAPPRRSHRVRNIVLGTIGATAITGLGVWGVQSLRNNDNGESSVSGEQGTPKINEAPGTPDSKSSFIPYESEGGVPFNSREFRGNVSPDEIMVITGGPMSITIADEKGNLATKAFEGGIDKGTVMIFVGKYQTNLVNVNGVEPGANWVGKFRTEKKPVDSWPQVLANSIVNMNQAPNCTQGQGCKEIDWVVIDSSTYQVIAESGKQNPGKTNQVPVGDQL